MAAASSNKKLAAAAVLVSLLALLVVPSSGLLGLAGSDCTVFLGWPLPVIVKSVICVILGDGNYTPPEPKKPPTGEGLSDGYYSKDPKSKAYCPGDVEAAVRGVVATAIDKDRGIGAGLIRLFFHDAFVQGCDASVLLNTTLAGTNNTEREGPPNKNSLRGFEVIDLAKEATKKACGGNVVSCADILALAARDASYILSYSKINYTVPTGRLDGRRSLATDTNTLPGPGSTFEQLVAMFEAQGLDAADMVTLSGAHSIGNARCLFSEGRRNSIAMDQDYAEKLNATCKAPETRVDQDPVTPYALDTQYYKNIDEKRVLFNSDAVLVSAEQQVKANIANVDDKWEHDFEAAMVKMGKIGVKTNPVPGFAEIRELCWKVNGI